MNKKLYIIITFFMTSASPLYSKGFGEWLKSIAVSGYLKFDEFKNRIPLEQLPTVVHDDFKSIIDLLIGAQEHVPHHVLRRTTGINRDLFFDEELPAIEEYLRPFIPETMRYNAVQLNNWRWALRGASFTATMILGGWWLYNSEASYGRKSACALGIIAAGYVSYRALMVFTSRIFNFAGKREFLHNARRVLNRPFDEVPEKFYEFHKKYQYMTNKQLLEAFSAGHFVKDIVESLMPKGLF